MLTRANRTETIPSPNQWFGLKRGSEPPPSVTVVVPTRNESRNLQHVLPRLPDCVTEVVIVDGGSTDGTIEEALRLRPDAIIVGQTGPGKGNALLCGFVAATADIIVMLDADGSADPGEIDDFVGALVDGADFAKGSRFLQGGGSHDITRLRKAGNRVLTLVVNRIFGVRYTDLCYGYNAFWRRCLPVVQPDAPGFEIETQINIRIAKGRLNVAEVPSVEHARIHGVSNLNAYSDGLRVARAIIRECITRPRPEHPAWAATLAGDPLHVCKRCAAQDRVMDRAS